MIIVNLYGAPGAGKSTGAAYIFSKLKMLGVNAELVTEVAKDKVWEESKEAFNNQAYLFGQQSFRISRCEHKVEAIVTDSPLLLSAFYNTSEVLGEDFNKVVANVAKSYDTLDYLVLREKPYNPIGRRHTEEESDKIAFQLKSMLDRYKVDYNIVRGYITDYDKIIEKVLKAVLDNRKETE